MRVGLLVALICQAAAIAVAFFVPFGFDKPSSLGLDFGHLLLLLGFYALSLLFGVVIACCDRKFAWAGAQVALGLFAIALIR